MDRLKKIPGTELGIGDVELAVVKPCARCVVTTIDKETLEQSKEPLKTLGKYRKHKLGAIFGQNVIPLNGGSIRLGMNVEILFLTSHGVPKKI